MTQEVLSERAGISRNFLALLESGKRRPSWITVLRLVEALNISISDFHTATGKELSREARMQRIYKVIESLNAEDMEQVENMLEATMALIKNAKK